MNASEILKQTEERTLEVEKVMTDLAGLAIEKAEEYVDANPVFDLAMFRASMYDNACDAVDNVDYPQFEEWECEFLIASYVFTAIAFMTQHLVIK